jgi:hypothetical protein
MSFQFPPNSVSSAGFSRGEPMITPEQLKARYFFGVDLTDQKGNPVPPEVFQHQINAAVSYVEHKLDIIIMPTKIVDNHDFRAIDYQEFNFIQLKKRPIIEVTALKAQFPNKIELIDYPPEWFVLEKEAAQLQLAPVSGSFNGLAITAGGSIMPLLFGTKQSWPHMFEVSYTAGFCNDQVPIILNEMIGLQAAISMFQILRDTIHGPVAGENTSLDGAATGRNNYATGPFGPRIDSYQKKLDEYLKVAHKYYNGFAFTVP